MKKNIVLLTILLISCAPQVPVTSEVTVTLLPASPTPEATSTPEPTATPAAETMMLGGVTLTLDENGVVNMMEVNGNYTDEQKAEKLAVVDPTNWGFQKGEVQIVKEELGIYIVSADNPELKIAKWLNEWEWSWEALENYPGGNPIFNGFAKTVNMDNGHILPAQQKEARADAAQIRAFNEEEAVKISGRQFSYPIYLYDGVDKTQAVVAHAMENMPTNTDPNMVGSTVIDGWVSFKTASGKLVRMRFKDIEVFMRRFG